MREQDTETQELTVTEAADAFANLLDGDDAEDTGADESDDPSDDELEVDADEDEAESDEEEGEAEEGEGDDDEEPEDEDEGAQSEAKFTVKVNGEDREVTAKELVDSYQIGAAARQSLEAAAAKHKHLDAEYQGLQAFKTRVSSAVEAVEAAMADARFSDDELERLRDEDPAEWSARKEELRDKQAQAAALKADAEAIEHANASRNAEAKADRFQAEQTKLATNLGWLKQDGSLDKSKAAKDLDAIAAYAASALGVSDAEFDAIEDSRVIIALDKARQLDAARAKAKGARTAPKGRQAPKPTPTTLRPGSSDKPAKARSGQSLAMKRLAQTGRVKDAADAFTAFV